MTAKQVLLLSVKVLCLAVILTLCFSVAGAISGLGRVQPQPQVTEARSQHAPTVSPRAPTDNSKMQFHPKPGLGPTANATTPPPKPADVLRLLFLACLLQTIVLTYIILRSCWTGWKLVGAVSVGFFGAVSLQAGLESAIYLRYRFPGLGLRILVMGAITAGVFSPLAVLILSRFRGGAKVDVTPHRPIAAWKALAVVAGFLAVYYTCGYYIAWQSPFVREFYGGSDPGSFFKQLASIWSTTPWMYFFQALRGLLYLFIALPVAWMFKGKSWEVGLAVALLFSVVGSVQLILPNPLMGDAVARVHLVEILVGNSIFGWFTGWLVRRSTRTVRAG